MTRACAAWPAWSKLLRGWLGDAPTEGAEAGAAEATAWLRAPRPAWRPSAGPSEPPALSTILPALPGPRFKIQCIPLEPADALREGVRVECETQAAAGLRLVSTFTHDGHVFLIFKRP